MRPIEARMVRLRVTALRLPFVQRFTHASAERNVTQSVWVEAESTAGSRGFGEGCPREYVTEESLESAIACIHALGPVVADLDGVGALRAWVSAHRELIDANPAAWCAVELALLDVMARDAGCSVEALLGLPPITGPFQYSAVLGAESLGVFRTQLARYLHLGMRDFKVKLSGTDEDFERAALLKAAAIATIRVDANNLWRSPADAIGHLRRFDVPITAIEEPLGTGSYEDLRVVAASTGCRVILDESFLRADQFRHLDPVPGPWILNLRLSKLGGLLRSLDIARDASARGIPFVIGCQVGESSLLTRAALTLAQATRDQGLIAQEGAFGLHLLQRDVVEHPLMFGARGVLDVAPYDFTHAAGFGLKPALQAKAPT